MVSWRMLLATGDPAGADLIERTLHNVVATSPRSDGRFYANTLHQRAAESGSSDDTVSPRAESAARAAWFGVSCCPTNVARTLASLSGYVATTDDDGVHLHLYASAHITASLAGGGDVAFEVATAYPASGGWRYASRSRTALRGRSLCECPPGPPARA